MDSGINLTSLSNGLDNRDTVGVSVLKKAMDMQKDTANQLIEAIPDLPKSSPTESKGNNIDVFA